MYSNPPRNSTFAVPPPATIHRYGLQALNGPVPAEQWRNFLNKTILDPNDLLLICTDGVPEAHSANGQQLGATRFLSVRQPANSKEQL